MVRAELKIGARKISKCQNHWDRVKENKVPFLACSVCLNRAWILKLWDRLSKQSVLALRSRLKGTQQKC